MQKYEVILESQTDGHKRFVTLSSGAASRQDQIAEVRAVCEGAEADLCAFRLDPDALAKLEDEGHRIDSQTGKVYGPTSRGKANYHAHFQDQPYRITNIEHVGLSDAQVENLITEITRLKGDPDKWKAVLNQLRERDIPLAAVTGFMYGVPVKNQYDGTAVVDWDTNTIKCALLTGHTPSQDTHDFFDDVSGNEITGTGYSAGGATLTSTAATYDTASDQCRLDAADTSWTSSTLSATHAVVYKSTGTSSTSPLMGLVDFGGTVSTTSGTFQITWDSTGIIVIDVT